MSEYGRPFFISYVKVEQVLDKGDKVYTIVEETRTPELSQRFSGVDKGENISSGYDVTSVYKRYSRTAYSQRSAVENVDWNQTSADAVAANALNVIANGGKIVVTSPSEDRIDIFDLTGRRVFSEKVDAGNNIFDFNRQGIYIVKVGDVVRKITVR